MLHRHSSVVTVLLLLSHRTTCSTSLFWEPVPSIFSCTTLPVPLPICRGLEGELGFQFKGAHNLRSTRYYAGVTKTKNPLLAGFIVIHCWTSV